MRYNFMNDYNELTHERILNAIVRANREQDNSYGLDSRCEQARQLIRARLGGAESDVHFLVGGTQANLTIIAASIKPYQGVICAESGHINTHETGAIEATGHKVLSLPTTDGKITAGQVEACAAAHYADCNAEHIVQPGMVYLSQPSETGTIYHKSELEAIRCVCRSYDMPLYIDGARLGNSFAAKGADVFLPELAKHALRSSPACRPARVSPRRGDRRLAGADHRRLHRARVGARTRAARSRGRASRTGDHQPHHAHRRVGARDGARPCGSGAGGRRPGFAADPTVPTNARQIERLTGVAVLGTIPFDPTLCGRSPACRQDAWKLVEANVDEWTASNKRQ